MFILLKVLKKGIIVIIFVLLLPFVNNSRGISLNSDNVWHVGNSWGTVTTMYNSDGKINSVFNTNNTVKNISIWNNEKVFVLLQESNDSVNPSYQFYDNTNFTYVGGIDNNFPNETDTIKVISSYNSLDYIKGPGNFTSTTTMNSEINYKYTDNTSIFSLAKQLSFYNSTSLVQITSEKKDVKAGTFDSWKLIMKPIFTYFNVSFIYLNNQTQNLKLNITYVYLTNNIVNETVVFSPNSQPSFQSFNTSDVIYTEWISKSLGLMIASESSNSKSELVYLNLNVTNQSFNYFNYILPATYILIGGLAIGSVYVFVELLSFRKSIKNAKDGNTASFSSYLKEKTFKHNKKKKMNNLSDTTLKKMENEIKRNKMSFS